MAIVKAQFPFPSASNSNLEFTHDVFLSFRGTDTRLKFTDFLYAALKYAGFETFRDNKIERGEKIYSELEKAIKNSRMSIIVFSENYVSSKACLFEVETILQHSKKSKHIIFPIFYHVDPVELKRQVRARAAATKGEREERWSAALTEVVSRAGMHLTYQHEAKFVQKIIKVVEGKLRCKAQHIGPQLIGIDARVKKINSWLKDRSTNAGMLVICGMGGIGKTTIAKVAYNANYGRFDRSSFLENIREVSQEANGLLRLQKQLLGDILHKKIENLNDINEGNMKIKRALKNKRILLVLDDVDKVDQWEAIFDMQKSLGIGAKIVVTTRKEKLLNPYGNYEIHRVEKLSSDESFDLFNLHAFGKKDPEQRYVKHSRGFVYHCDGLPLALKVLGSSMSGQNDFEIWESTLRKLGAIPNTEVLKKLKISYDSLQDDHDRNLFLDIACFFIGKRRSDAIAVLNGCNYYTAVGIQNLIDRCLLIVENEKLRMHQLLQDMGREIVCKESKHPEERSRVWHHRESFDILHDEIGTTNIEGIILDMNMLENSNKVLETKAFNTMRRLRLLKLSYLKLIGTYELLPNGLRWLYWRGFHLKSLPDGFPMGKLVALDVRNSNLEQVWKGTKVLGTLRIINLSHSPRLSKITNFSMIPNVEKLILKDCPNLVEVDESIVKLEKLVFLNLKDCKNLSKLPCNLSSVKYLEELIISGCSNLFGVAEELEKMGSLRVLRADRIAINQVLCATRDATPWYASIIPWITTPRTNPDISWSSLPSSLVTLTLVSCNLSNDSFPEDFSNLSMLQHLYLGGNQFSILPECIKDLSNLQRLDLSWSPRLKEILWPSIVIEELIVTECRSLEKITYDTSVGALQRISHGACWNLCYVQRGFKIELVANVDIEVINSIGFFDLDSKAEIEIFIINVIVWSTEKRPIQILYENGVFNTYFPGKEVPHWFSEKSNGSTLSFIVPSFPYLRIRGFNLCLVYTLAGVADRLPIPICVNINNKSKRREGTYTPRCYGIPEAGEDIVWLVHLGSMFLFEEGDEIHISFNMMIDGEIKECGAHILYYEEEEELDQYYNTLLSLWDLNMRRMQVALAASENYEEEEEEEEEEDEEEEIVEEEEEEIVKEGEEVVEDEEATT